MGLYAQGNRRQAVCQKIDKQQMYRCKRNRKSCYRRAKNRQDCSEVSGQQKLDCVLNIPIDVTAIFHRLYNCCEVIIGKHHRCGILGNLCSGDSHGNANVCLLQRGGVIDAVSGHCDNHTSFLPCADNADLMLRRYSCVHRNIRNQRF